jgi:hypothetical protein
MESVSAFLDVRKVKGTSVVGVRNTDFTLVKRNEQSGTFEPVDKLDRGISSSELDAKYGVWVDAERRHWSPTLLNPFRHVVDRPQDGQIQDDEVVDFQTFRASQRSIEGHWLYGTSKLYEMESAEVQMEDVGNGVKAAVLQTRWSMRHIEAQYSDVSPLSPPYQAGWRSGMVGD